MFLKTVHSVQMYIINSNLAGFMAVEPRIMGNEEKQTKMHWLWPGRFLLVGSTCVFYGSSGRLYFPVQCWKIRIFIIN